MICFKPFIIDWSVVTSFLSLNFKIPPETLIQLCQNLTQFVSIWEKRITKDQESGQKGETKNLVMSWIKKRGEDGSLNIDRVINFTLSILGGLGLKWSHKTSKECTLNRDFPLYRRLYVKVRLGRDGSRF